MSPLRKRRSPIARLLAGAAATALVAAGLVASASPASAQIVTGQYYQLISAHSGKAVDVASSSTEPGAMIQQWAPSGGQNQQFRFEPSGGGFYRIVARHSGHVLDVWEWNPAGGAEIRQWNDLNATNQQWSVVDHGGEVYSFINNFSGLALDVWEWSTADGGRLSQWDYTGGNNQRFQLVPVGGGPDPGPGPGGGADGWASTNGGTSGGTGGSTVTVSNFSQLSSAMQQSGPLTIQVQGAISCSGMNDVASDKTIVGLGSNAAINGCGLDLNGVSNVIIRNLTFNDWDDDAINVQESTTNVWIDHNTFTGGSDGAVDIKRESDFVTVSWNHFTTHDHNLLLGHSDSHTEDIGHLRVSYHHNWFDGTEGRHPRVRFGNPVHVYNNYYDNNPGYGIASTMGAGVLVEGNYFEGVDNPSHVGYASSDPGSLVFQNNVLDNSGTPESTSGGVAGIPYGYQLDSPNSIPSIVTGGAGAGQINP